MSQTAAQLVALATQIAKCPGFIIQGGQFLNLMLQDLAQTYDFDVARGTYNFNFTGGLAGNYNMPADYLRARPDECFFTLFGVPYRMTPIDLSEYDGLVQTAGFNDYPTLFASDMSQAPPVMKFWPPPSGAYPVTIRYQRQMPDIVTPETSATVPWFPNQDYLLMRLCGELMRLTNDDRWMAFLSNDAQTHPDGAGSILRRYLQMKDDGENRTKTVGLDPRRFRPGWRNLPNTKQIGW